MAFVLQLGNRKIDSTELVSLLAQYQLLPQLLREMTIDSAIAQVALTEEEQTIAEEAFNTRYQITDEAARQAWIKQQGLTNEQLEQNITRPLRIEKFKQSNWGNRLESYFLIQKPQYDQVTYSLLRTPDPEVAQELYFRIKGGEQTFAELAQTYSDGPEAESDGVIGPVPLSQPHPAIAEKLRHSQIGLVHPPTKMGEWYVLLRLDALIVARLDPAMRQKLLDELFETWLTGSLTQSPTPTAPPVLA